MEDVSLPPADSASSVHVLAAPVNAVDLLIAAGGHPALRPQRPYVPGFEVVGTYDSRLVWALPGTGGLAERCAVDAATLVDVPPDTEPTVAAAVGVAGVAAWIGVVQLARVAEGETVAVLAARSALGRAAIQLARLRGARVIAVTSAREVEAGELRADAVVHCGDATRVGAQLLELHRPGVDVVIDPIFGPASESALSATAPGARVVMLGRIGGSTVTLSPLVVERCLTIYGHRNSASSPGLLAPALTEMCALVRSGAVTIDFSVVSLQDAALAWQRHRQRPGHRYVVVP